MRVRRVITTLPIVVALVASALVAAPARAANLAVVAATPSGANAPRTSQIDVTFSEPIVPASFAGSVNGAAMVPTQIVVAPDATHVRVDPGELEYATTYTVVVASSVQAQSGGTLGVDSTFSFTVAANPSPKRPTTNVVVPSGPFDAGQPVTLSGQASGFVWQRDPGNPLALRHWDHNGNDLGDAPMLHPTVLYFPDGIDGYKFYLYYTPYPGAEDPVVMRSNDGVHFDATGIPKNPIFTYGMQPPYDLQNLADPEAVKVGDTWMLFYEMETGTVLPYMTGNGGYIGVALSTDGKSWTPYGGPYTYDPQNPPTAFPADGNPVIDPTPYDRTGEPAVVFKDGVYHMWRTVLDGGGVTVVHDTAPDPRGPWTKLGVAIPRRDYNYGPHVDVVYDAARDLWTMLYLGPAGADMGQLDVYTATSPDGPWSAHPLNPVFRASGTGWEGSTLYRSSLVDVNGQWYLYYSGQVGNPGQIGLARETPGVRKVEVSTNDGQTWAPATVSADGTWTFTWTPPANGDYKISARVTDDFMLGDTTTATTVAVGDGALQPPSEPILLVTDRANTTNPFNGYLAEIMRAEGLVEFQQVDVTDLMASPDPAGYLGSFGEVVLADARLDSAAQQRLRDYVTGGGNLLAMRPDEALADLFGLTYLGARPEQLLEFFTIDTTRGPGVGITAQSLQYHGEADDYTLNGATSLAKLNDAIDTPSNNPAATVRTVGQGHAAAFTFDLAKSVVLTRQGNPAWKDQELDGQPGYRPADLFGSNPSYLAPQRLAVPQADEAQRFFANLVLDLEATPMPRLWYLPGTHTSLIVNTGDGEDDGETGLAPPINDANGYGGAFTTYLREAGISGTSVQTEAAWRAAGNEQAVHVYGDRTYDGMSAAEAAIVGAFEAKFGHGVRTARNHTIAWTGYVDMAAIEAANGVELDTNYYHYLSWLRGAGINGNGWFSGSGLPQRFSDERGNVLPIYQALTEWPDEWFADNGYSAQAAFDAMKAMLDAADNGYYSAFVDNIHAVRYNGVDPITHTWANMLWAYARDHGIPMWSAEHLADFAEARDGSQFRNIAWNGTRLAFDFTTTKSGQQLTIMVPAERGSSQLLSVALDGSAAPYTVKAVKGHEYAMVTTTAGSAHVVADYGLDTTPPSVSGVRATNVTGTTATVTWTTNETADSQVEYGTTPAYGTATPTDPAAVTAHSVTLTGLDPKTAYHFRVRSSDGAGNATVSDDFTFTTGLPAWVETSAADFADGTATDTVVQPAGSVTLGVTGSLADSFDGTALDGARWASGSWAGAPSVTVAGGTLTVANSSWVKSVDTFSNETLEGRVTFTDGPNAHFGFATAVNAGDDGISDPHWAIFTAKNGTIQARTRVNDGQGDPGGEINTTVPVSLGVPHDFKIVWHADGTVEFWADGAIVATHHRTFTERMRVYVASGQTTTVDSVLVSGAYARSGSYTSSVFDAGRLSAFASLTSQATVPAAASVSFETRTSLDGTGWSGWEPVAGDGAIASPIGRFVQYRATLTSADGSATPSLDEVAIGYDTATDTTPPAISGTVPADGANGVNPDAPVTIDFNEPIDTSSLDVSLGGAAFTTSFTNANRRAVLTPTGGLPEHRSVTVTIAAGLRDLAGNATGTPVTFAFTTGNRTHAWTDTTNADFGAGTHTGTTVANVGDGAVTLGPTGFADAFSEPDGAAANWEIWRGLVDTSPLPVWDVQNGVFVHEVNHAPQSYHPAVLSSVLTPSGDFTMSARERFTQIGTGSGDGPALGFVWGGTTDRDYWWVQYAPGTYGGLKIYRVTAPLNLTAVAQNVALPFPVIDQWYDLTLEVTGTTFKVYVDGVLQLTGNDPAYAPGRIGLVAYQGSRQEYDDVTVSTGRAPSGTFTSRIADAGRSAAWQSVATTGTTPAGTAVAVATRTGDTATPDASWSDWAPLGAGGAVANPAGRYLQYRLDLSTAAPAATPTVESVTATYAFVNRLPVTGDDHYTTAQDTALTVAAPGVLANDTDPDADALAASVLAGPVHGQLTLHADGSFAYVPDAGWSGTDGFTYLASDGALTAPATATITVTHTNRPPVANGDSYTTAEDTPLVRAAPGVLGNDTDADGDALAAQLVSEPTHGTLTLAPDGSFTYTPAANWHGTDGFTYRAADGAATSELTAVILEVTAVNDAPVLSDPGPQTAKVGTAVTPVAVHATDLDGDAVTFTAAGLPPGLVINPAGVISGTPTSAAGSPFSVTVTADDGHGGTGTATFAWTVTPLVCPAGQWLAEYYPNRTLSAAPSATRCEATLDNNWGYAAPAGTGVRGDDFSVRWTTTATFAGGVTFTTTADDGIRLSVDGIRRIDDWTDHGATTRTSAPLYLTGTHTITVEYYEHTGAALARAGWTMLNATSSCPVGQWLAAYYPNTTLSGPAAVTRCETTIDNSWGYAAPGVPLIGGDNFSVRWTRSTTFAAGHYVFSVTGDDGIRLLVDGVTRLDDWADHSARTRTVGLDVGAGSHTVVVEYYEHTGAATAKAGWTTG